MDFSYEKYLVDFLDRWNRELEREDEKGFDRDAEIGSLSDILLLMKRCRDMYPNSSLLYFLRERCPLITFSFLGTIFCWYKRDWDKTWELIEKSLDFSVPKILRALLEKEVVAWLAQNDAQLKCKTIHLEPQSEVGEKQKRKRGKQLPEKRGGRPRGVRRATEKPAIIKSKTHVLRPEIICWKRERQWTIGLEGYCQKFYER